MYSCRLRFCYTGLLTVFLVTTGCSYQTAVQRLSLPEQTEFYTYHKVMTWAQVRAYLDKATQTERTAYLHASGLAQRFQGLDPLDREAIQAGYPRPGMSAEALLFLWGLPHRTEGRTNYYEYWHYLGSSLSLADSGNNYHTSGNQVEVHLDHGRVTSWLDYVPTNDDKGDDWGI